MNVATPFPVPDHEGASSPPSAAAWADLPLESGVLRATRHDVPTPARASATAFTVAVCTYRRPESMARLLGSMVGQARPACLLVVDASDDEHTERVMRDLPSPGRIADRIDYYRVASERRGVTLQRNFALDRTRTPLVAFFDDDVVLGPGCLAALVDAHVRGGPTVAGVGAAIDNEPAMPMRWRARRLLGIVPSLAPGRYHASGVSTPWGFIPPSDALLEGDWLPGGAAMWKTEAARAVGFDEALGGYGCGNDLAFSLAMAAQGRQILAASARVHHLHAAPGRPDTRSMAREAMSSAHAIHAAFADRGVAARVWFGYAVVADTVLTALGLLRPRGARRAAEHLLGVVDYWRTRTDARGASLGGDRTS